MGFKPRNIDVIATPNSSNGYDFVMEENGGTVNNNTISFNKNTDNLKKVNHYRVTFHLKNRGGATLRFSRLIDKVLWVQRGTTCPKAAAFLPGDFWVDSMSDSKIEVINMDMHQEELAFALNFVPEGTVEDPTTVYIPYDPIVDNRNGGSAGSNLQAWAPIAIGACAGLAAFAGAQMLFNS